MIAIVTLPMEAPLKGMALTPLLHLHVMTDSLWKEIHQHFVQYQRIIQEAGVNKHQSA